MAGRFVRSSKYRHVYGQPAKKEHCFENVKVTRNAWDSNLIKANSRYLSVNWEAAGGGAFAVIPIDEVGRLPERMPLCRGHTGPVLDTDWNPFNDQLVASASEDGKINIWNIPEHFTINTDADEPADLSPISTLIAHKRKVGHLAFNPAVDNTLASSSTDNTAMMWDVEHNNAPVYTLKHADWIQSISWKYDGSLLITTCRDKTIRVWDVRQEKPTHKYNGHARNNRVVYLGNSQLFATTGATGSDRELGLWNLAKSSGPLNPYDFLGTGSGVCMPFWDNDAQMLYVAGRGDGNIRYYELENELLVSLSDYSSADPQRGLAFLPKVAVDVQHNPKARGYEIARAYKTVGDSYIEPISFIVPRRAEAFQDDVYYPTLNNEPVLPHSEWAAGKDVALQYLSMQSKYDDSARGLVSEAEREVLMGHAKEGNDQAKPPTPQQADATKAPSPTSTDAVKSTVASATTAVAKTAQTSLAAVVNKFTIKDNVELEGSKPDPDEEDASYPDFDTPLAPSLGRGHKPTITQQQEVKSGKAVNDGDKQAVDAGVKSTTAVAEPATNPESSPPSSSGTIQASLAEFRAAQAKQAEEIAAIKAQMARLDSRLSDLVDNQNEKFRGLELQVEDLLSQGS